MIEKNRYLLPKETGEINRKLEKSKESVGVTIEERDRVIIEHGRLVTQRDGLKADNRYIEEQI